MAFYQIHRHLLARPPETSPPPPAAEAAASAYHPPPQMQKSLSIAFGSALCVAVAYLIVVAITNYLRNRPANSNDPAAVHDDSKHRRDADRVSLQLEAIPVVAYAPGSSHSEEEVCSICLGEYAQGVEVRALPKCRHVFHKGCVDRWLLTRSSFCPICRARAVERAVEPEIKNPVSNNGGGGGGDGSRLDVRVIGTAQPGIM